MNAQVEINIRNHERLNALLSPFGKDVRGMVHRILFFLLGLTRLNGWHVIEDNQTTSYIRAYQEEWRIHRTFR